MKTTATIFTMSLGLILMLSSCEKEDPTTDLVITIEDESGTSIRDVVIDLYSTKATWEESSSKLVSLTTNSDGKVIFTDLQSNVYYVDAHKGAHSNWNTTIKSPVLLQNQENVMTVTISDHLVNKLIGKKEQSYELTDVRLQGTSIYSEIDLCERDNVTFFQRDDQVGAIDPGQELCPGETQALQLFTWRINSDQTVITTTFESGEETTYQFVSFEGQKLFLETTIPIGNQLVPIETEFTKL